ncbi:hypothetical protein B0H14DRAFT_3432206 [Mycena olivaceomarginata]|nr:hypothetical protein B0H14DRAFT_3432206 [Mycena olivaceomarginata]
MPYRYIHPQQKRLLPTIKQTVHKNRDIANMTEIGERTVRRTLKNYYDYGDLHAPSLLFVALQLQKYLEGLVERKPDSTAAELRHGLREGMRIDVDESTITRALHRRGYLFKTVSRTAIEQSKEKRDNYEATVRDLGVVDGHQLVTEHVAVTSSFEESNTPFSLRSHLTVFCILMFMDRRRI